MDQQTVLATLEQRLALELGRQNIMRMRAEVERDVLGQTLAQQAAQADAAPAEPEPETPATV